MTEQGRRPGETANEQILLQVRPRRIAIYASIGAFAVVASMVVIGVLLRSSEDGVSFRLADQIGLIGIGLLLGAAIMAMARPRLRVTVGGVLVRNVLGERYFEWQLVHRIAFPEGANWAQVKLADDEAYPLMAIQAIDRERAVAALKELRELHERYAPKRLVKTPPAGPVAPPPDRPLGRLEKIDLELATKREAKRSRS